MTRRRLLLLGIAAAVIVLDQLSKWWALERLDGGDIVEIVWTLRFRLAFNKGTAFSLGSGSGAGAWLAVVALVVVLALVWRSRLVSTRWGAVAVGLILGGALGNIADRALRGDAGLMSGAVVDFVDLQWWPVFNLADAAICIGAGVLIVGMLFWYDDAPTPSAADGDAATGADGDDDLSSTVADKATS